MSVLLTLFWYWTEATPEGGLSDATLAKVREVLAETPGLTEAQIFTPASAEDIYTDDGRSPPLGLQHHFDSIASLEAAAGRGGALQALGQLDGLDPARAEAQAFLRRDYPVDDPAHPPGASPCSFVVHYPGPAEDVNTWLGYYIDGHPPLMRRMPGIRAIEILTPVDWVNRLPIPSVRHMQRNRVLFDSPEALTAALQSPIRHELRADFDTLPKFEGGNRHYAMLTETWTPQA
ncbi:hypothetical protein GI374_03655 [Paracoccus sp. S-4012]|uniref:hypothetical protein n=1 Tax=Paracoccus sp. S-4012 TaxID=2665648 RepID=UPI0012B04F1D|nr:hypothetical protein [Paracoccus sp. S-4012]MRX49553.1 hypothetical protein [Paracoccus sp. S-4012]